MDVMSNVSTRCVPGTFSPPQIFGTELLTLETTLVHDFSRYVSDQDYVNHPEILVENTSFCNVTLTYTHPGQGDTVAVEAWLPTQWNNRFQAVGSGGWTAGRSELTKSMMAGAVGQGYATITTDAGLGAAQLPHSWALLSPGNVNWNALQNLASISLDEQASIGKQLIQSFYNRPPQYSYFNGCSQGGRQGLQLAQRYPKAYDGIAAATPAVYWPQFFQAMLWPQLVMKIRGIYPRGCELDFLQSAVLTQCGDDEGIIEDPDACNFDPFQFIGTPFYCKETDAEMELSEAAATIADAYRKGAQTADGAFLWYGPNWGANLTSTIFGTPGLAATACGEDSNSCYGRPFPFALFWFRFFAKKDPLWEFDSLTLEDYVHTFKSATKEYASILGTDDPDLSLFESAGGKMITYHGLSDDITPAKGTEHYYKEVTRLSPNVHDFYRYFEVPGLGHCYGGNGGRPNNVFEALRAWVENGTAPDSIPIDITKEEKTQTRILCPFPKKRRAVDFVRADGTSSTEYHCSV